MLLRVDFENSAQSPVGRGEDDVCGGGRLSAAGIALLVVPWLWIAVAGARLRNDPADPALAERWVAFHARGLLFSLLGLVGAILALEATGWAWLWLAWIVGYYAALYPARRRVLGERWSLGAYLGWQLRWLAVMGGYPLALALLPALANTAGPWQWPAALLAAALLVWWSERFPRNAVAVFGAQPLEQPALQERFAAIVARAACAPPRVFRAGRAGGSIANAVALPSARDPRVVFFDTLLEQLEPASLARRIRALRDAMGTGTASGPAFAPLAVRDAERAGTFVLLDVERIQWLSGVPEGAAAELDALRDAARSIETFRYAELGELRVRSQRSHVYLQQRARDGGARSARLHADDVVRVQSALDHADLRLGSLPAPRGSRRWLPIVFGVVLASAAAAIGAALPVLYVAFVAVLRPRRSSIAALGGTAVGVLLLALVWQARGALVSALVGVAALLSGALALYGLRGVPAASEPAGDRSHGGLWLLALPACLLPLALIALGPAPLSLHGAVLAMPAGVVLGCACCAGLLLLRSPLARRVGVLAGVLALLQLGAGSGWFRVHVAAEPLLALGPPLAAVRWKPEIEQREPIAELGAVSVRLSPDASAFAIGLRDIDAQSDDDVEPVRFAYGPRGGATRTVVAIDFQFADEQRAVLLARRADGGFEVRALSLADGATTVLASEPGLSAPQLSVEPGTGAWSALGDWRRGGGFERLDGTLAGLRKRTHFALPEDGWALPAVPSVASVLVQVMRARTGGSLQAWLRGMRWALLQLPASERSELRVLSGSASALLAASRSWLSCGLAADARGYVCDARHRDRMELWAIDPRTRKLRPLGGGELGYGSWSARGDELVLLDQHVRWLNARERRLYTASRAALAECITDAAIAPHEVVLLNGCEDESALIYVRKPSAASSGDPDDEPVVER